MQTLYLGYGKWMKIREVKRVDYDSAEFLQDITFLRDINQKKKKTD